MFLIYLGCSANQSYGQGVLFQPEVLVGNRSAMFQHHLDIPVKRNISFSNYLLIDSEYNRDENQIYFVRNMLSFKNSEKWRSNIAFGVKNPGIFSTVSWTYKRLDSEKVLIYTVGVTLQKTLSLEQSLVIKRNLIEFENYIYQFQLLVVANFDFNGYSRGLQQFRFALQNENFEFGVGINLDQFNNSTTVLENYGVFIKMAIQNKS